MNQVTTNKRQMAETMNHIKANYSVMTFQKNSLTSSFISTDNLFV